MTTRLLAGIVLLGISFPGAGTAAAVSPGQSVFINYSARASFQQSVATQSVFLATQPGADFVAPGPDGAPLFAVDVNADSLTITALRGFTDPTFFELDWSVSLNPPGGTSFSSANLVSSSLFSLPDFTFAVVPTVTFDNSTHVIDIHRFLTGGGNGIPTVNDGGSVVVGFTTAVPEPSTAALLVLSAGAGWVLRRRR